MIAFNGEIYNHLDLREELGNRFWRGRSDTETLLAAFEAWGIETTLKKSTGMFAIALWDQSERMLILARDRMGEKPLYYGWQGNTFLFGSELKAIKCHPDFSNNIDRNSISLLLRYNCIPAPYSIYRGIQKLMPGTWVKVRPAHMQASHYWSFRAAAESGLKEPFEGDDEEAIAALEKELMESVKQQMVADVPLGAFLSGGVDSSAVAALMQVQSSCPIKTFTIGFTEPGYNEADHASAVARHLETEHTELYIRPEDAMSIIPLLPSIYDEPFSDSSQIPTFLVAKLARQQVTVSLSGDGGDELFCGYNRYLWGARIWKKVNRTPKCVRGMLAGMLTGIQPGAWDRVAAGLSWLLPENLRYAGIGDKLHKTAKTLSAKSAEDIYLGLVSHWEQPTRVLQNANEPVTEALNPERWPDFPDIEHRMMYLDSLTYLPDDILTKVDRAAMNLSLETRIPLLNHHVVEFAWRLPLSLKIRDGQNKWILRQLLYRYVPRELIERPKMGFGIPLDTWLRGPLKDWAETLLDESRLVGDGFFDPAPIRKKWEEHLEGRRNWSYHLWDILMFQAWLDHNA